MCHYYYNIWMKLKNMKTGSLNKGCLVCSNSKVFAGTNGVVELAKSTDVPAPYIHPTTKQCNYSYTHPTEKQCNYTPDLSNYATKADLSSVSSPWSLLESYTGSSNINALTNLNYSLFLLTLRFSATSGTVRIIGEYGQVDILDRNGATNGTSFVYFIRSYCDANWRSLSISAFWLEYGGQGTTPKLQAAYMENRDRNFYLSLYVNNVSSFSAKMYGIS